MLAAWHAVVLEMLMLLAWLPHTPAIDQSAGALNSGISISGKQMGGNQLKLAPCVLELRGGGTGPFRRRRPDKDPLTFGPTDLLDMMTRGQYSSEWVRLWLGLLCCCDDESWPSIIFTFAFCCLA